MEMLEVLVQSINFVSVNNYFQYKILVTRNQIFFQLYLHSKEHILYTE